VAPADSTARTNKLRDTDGSPASILVTRDWLDFIRLRTRSAKDETSRLRFNSVGECELHFNERDFLSGQAEELFS
jgi:hypothetical protein